MSHLSPDDDELGTRRLERTAAGLVVEGFSEEFVGRVVDDTLRARMQARQIIEQLNLPSINSWTHLVQLLEAALARVEDGGILEKEVPSQTEETADEDPGIVESVRVEATDIIWQLEPEHMDGQFQISQILKRALEHARIRQWLQSKPSKP